MTLFGLRRLSKPTNANHIGLFRPVTTTWANALDYRKRRSNESSQSLLPRNSSLSSVRRTSINGLRLSIAFLATKPCLTTINRKDGFTSRRLDPGFLMSTLWTTLENPCLHDLLGLSPPCPQT